MDPKALGTSEWQQIIVAVNQFWFFAVFLVVAALSFALAHGAIPSLLASRQAGPRARLVRMPLYVVSLIAIVLTAIALYRAIAMTLPVLREIYPRWWV